MIKDTQKKRQGLHRAFMGLVFLSILIFGLFNGFLPKTAEAANNYISNISFYADSADSNRLILKFHVNTTFTATITGQYALQTDSSNGFEGYMGIFWQKGKFSQDSPLTYTAGNTYENYIWNNIYLNYYPDSVMTQGGVWGIFTSQRFIGNLGNMWMRGYPQYFVVNPDWFENDDIYFAEVPSLTITFPQNNYEIAEAFNIQGSYTLPVGSGYNILMAGFFKAGNYDVNWNNAVNVFTIPVSEPSGSFDNLRVSNYLPKDIYDIYFRVYGGGRGYEFLFHISNVKVVSDLPYELPITKEVSPTIPVFTTLTAKKIYTDYSNYPTSTALYITLTDTLEPLVILIGDNLTFFSSQFNIANAKEAGEKAGEAVLLVRSYANNLNAFFNNLPIAQVLFLYVSLLVVVAVFRIVRLLLKLIPFT